MLYFLTITCLQSENADVFAVLALTVIYSLVPYALITYTDVAEYTSDVYLYSSGYVVLYMDKIKQ